MQPCVIVNPSARGDRAESICADLQRQYPDFSWHRSTRAGHARELAAQAVRDGVKTIVAAGGDGTVNEIVNGIADVPGGLEKIQFGVLPLGTINVFARELGMPRRLPAAVEVLRVGKAMAIDLGSVEYTAENGPRQRYFIQLAGAGLDSRAIELVRWELKKKLGPMAYIAAGFQALRETQPKITVSGDKTISGELILIGNGRFYGGSFPVFPRANLADGLLDICILPQVGLLRLLAAVPGLLTGRLYNLCAAIHLAVPSVTLSSPSRVTLQLDGDNVCELPAKLSVRPQALRVIVP